MHHALLKTPHTITVTHDGRIATRSVEMTQPRDVIITEGDLTLPAATAAAAVAPVVHQASGRSWARSPFIEARSAGQLASPFASTRLIDVREDEPRNNLLGLIDQPIQLIQS